MSVSLNTAVQATDTLPPRPSAAVASMVAPVAVRAPPIATAIPPPSPKDAAAPEITAELRLNAPPPPNHDPAAAVAGGRDAAGHPAAVEGESAAIGDQRAAAARTVGIYAACQQRAVKLRPTAAIDAHRPRCATGGDARRAVDGHRAGDHQFSGRQRQDLIALDDDRTLRNPVAHNAHSLAQRGDAIGGIDRIIRGGDDQRGRVRLRRHEHARLLEGADVGGG
jgi:hypothetical protein